MSASRNAAANQAGRNALTAALRTLKGRGIKELPVDHDAVLSLALETKLSAYDASYLWLALRFDAELVTLDKALAGAWAVKTRSAPDA